MPRYYLITTNGKEGPYSDVELLDLLDSELIEAESICESVPGGRRQAVGDLFEQIEPELEDEDSAEEDDDEEEIIIPAKRGKPVEEVIYKRCTSLLLYWPLFALAVGVVYFAYQQPDRGAWPLLVGCCGAVLLCLLAYVLSRRCSYEITNRRVVMHSGLIMRSTREVRVEDIRAINVVRKGLRSLLGVGSVEFSSAGGAEGEVVFRDITGCQHVRQLVRHLQG